jgi:hypothetical protein
MLRAIGTAEAMPCYKTLPNGVSVGNPVALANGIRCFDRDTGAILIFIFKK